MKWYLMAFKKYLVFSGRSHRKEFWVFFIINLIVSSLVVILDAAIFGVTGENELGYLTIIYLLVIILPSIAITIRRLHDTNHSGWWFLIAFLVPLLGPLWLWWLLCKDSDHALNRFGDDPTAENRIV